MAHGLYLKQLELGPMQNFVYLIGDPETRDCVVVDPAWEIDEIVDTVAADGMRLTGALVTHTHQDHVGGHLFGFDIPGVEELLAKAPAKVYVHKAEREFLKGFGSDLVKVEGGDTFPSGGRPSRSSTRPATRRAPSASWSTAGSSRATRSSSGPAAARICPGATRRRCTSRSRVAWARCPTRRWCCRATTTAAPRRTIGAEKRQNPMMRFASMTDFLRAMGIPSS